jgi:hypothetical protein
MDSWESVIEALCDKAAGGLAAAAEALGQTRGTVSGWKRRGIPASHWGAVVALAADRGKPDITLEVLAHLAARKMEDVRA